MNFDEMTVDELRWELERLTELCERDRRHVLEAINNATKSASEYFDAMCIARNSEADARHQAASIIDALAKELAPERARKVRDEMRKRGWL